jgi:hypothetical protein
MNPKKKLQKHQLTKESEWLEEHYNPERDGYNGWLLEVVLDTHIINLSVACERPTLYNESMGRDMRFSDPYGVRPNMVSDIYMELRQPMTDDCRGLLELTTQRNGYKKNMTLTRYVHGVLSERYLLVGSYISGYSMTSANEDGGFSFTLRCDYFTFTT